jgi:uncharacterized integral membrane protein
LGLCFTLALLVAVVAGMAREMQRNVLLGEWELPADIAILGRISPIVPAAQSRAPVEVSS